MRFHLTGKGRATAGGMGMMAVCVMLLLTPPAFANMWDGMMTAGGNTGYRGARINIDNYVPRYSSNGFSCAWSMLNDEDTYGLAQIGWTRGHGTSPASTVFYFYEYEDTTLPYDGLQQLSAVPNPGDWETDHLYTVQYGSGSASIAFRVDGVNKATVSKTEESLWWTPSQAEYMAEVIDNGDQVPGDLDHHVKYWNPAEYSSGTWHLIAPTGERMFMSSALTHAHQSHSQANYWFHTWDDRWSTQDN